MDQFEISDNVIFVDSSGNIKKVVDTLRNTTSGNSLATSGYSGTSINNRLPSDGTGSLFTHNHTQTSIDLTWNPSLSSNITGYNVYANGTLLGNTTSTSFSATGLTAATAYTISVKAVNSGGYESWGLTVNTQTEGTSYFIGDGLDTTYLESPSSLRFNAIEVDWDVTPPVNSWDNALIVSVPNGTYGLSCQFNGVNSNVTKNPYSNKFNLNLYINGASVGGYNQPMTVGSRSTYRLEFAELRHFTGSFSFLKSAAKADIYRIRFYGTGDKGEDVTIADYDLTHSVSNGQITDLMGNAPLMVYGGSFS